MTDQRHSNQPDTEGEHRVRDPEADRPFREAFARRLPPAARLQFEQSARAAYFTSLEANGGGYAFPDESDVRGQLAAAVVDLRETAELLASIERVPWDSSLEDPNEVMLCVLAGPRRLEAEAVAERVERMLAWQPTSLRPFPPGLETAALTPEAS